MTTKGSGAARKYLSSTGQMWRDPRIRGVATSGHRTAAFMRQHGGRPTLRLGTQVLLDEVVLSVLRNPALHPHGDDLARAGAEIAAAQPVWQAQGWAEKPETYHLQPPTPAIELSSRQVRRQQFETLSFDSGYEPHPDEPGAERWRQREYHRTAQMSILRDGRPGRPWLVCIHGFGMGQLAFDSRVFRAAQLTERHGLNLAFPVLPSHGVRRTPGQKAGEGFVGLNLMDSIHGLAQAVWEVRSLIRWIHEHDPGATVGVYGISLGACVAGLVASLEPDLACAIAAIPVSDFAALSNWMSPPDTRAQAQGAGAMGPGADAIARVVSPLHLTPQVAHDRRFIVAGSGDRMSPPAQARNLWTHWDEPQIDWYPGGHISFFVTKDAHKSIDRALCASFSSEKSASR